MDELNNISKVLNNNDPLKRKEAIRILKISLEEVQEEIDEINSDKKNNLNNKISRLQKLLNQIKVEIITNKNSYLLKSEEYKFPSHLRESNTNLSRKKKFFSETKKKLDENKKKLSSLLLEKKKYSDKFQENINIINDKRKKISNNIEITALVEKKKVLMSNKKNNDKNCNKEIEELNQNIKKILEEYLKKM